MLLPATAYYGLSSKKYFFLDRDGVIIHDSTEYIKTPDEWNPIERSLEAIKKLTDNDFQIIIITNQSGINRDIITPDNFLKINHYESKYRHC